jgi:hypothetical protein
VGWIYGDKHGREIVTWLKSYIQDVGGANLFEFRSLTELEGSIDTREQITYRDTSMAHIFLALVLQHSVDIDWYVTRRQIKIAVRSARELETGLALDE